MQPRLIRSRTEKMLFGVCGGLGLYFGIDPVIVRLVFVLLTISSGTGIPIYILLVILMPREHFDPTVAAPPPFSQHSRQHHGYAAPLEQQGEPFARWSEQQAAQHRHQVMVAQPPQQYQQHERVAQTEIYQQEPLPGVQPPRPDFRADIPASPDAATGPTVKLPHQQPSEPLFAVPPVEASSPRQRNWGTLGLILMGIGVLIMLEQLTGSSLAFVFPVLLIAAGVMLLVRWRP